MEPDTLTNNHKRKLLCLTYLLFIMVLFTTQVSAQSIIRNFSLPDSKNQILDLENLKGDNLTVIDFWTTWCKPCIMAIPELVKLQEKYDSLGVTFIGINGDGPRSVSKAMPLANSLGVTYPVVFDTSGDLASELNVTAYPTLFIIDKNREIIFHHEGFNLSDISIIEQALIKGLTN